MEQYVGVGQVGDVLRMHLLAASSFLGQLVGCLFVVSLLLKFVACFFGLFPLILFEVGLV